MPILKFALINPYERNQFKPIFKEYLEELTLAVGNSIDPDFIENFEEYPQYFIEDPNHIPFRIFYEEANPESEDITPIFIGFFFLHLITIQEFPPEVEPIFSEDETLACLNHFYIFPEFRRKGFAWNFIMLRIYRFVTENEWNTVWESDVRNEPANTFYEHLLERIQKEESLIRFKLVNLNIPYTIKPDIIIIK